MGTMTSGALGFIPNGLDYDDDSDFTERLGEYVSVLHGVALRLTRDPDRAEWLVRKTLATALSGRHTFTEDMHLKSWLLTILRNTFVKLDGALPGSEDYSARDDGSLSYYLDLKQCNSLVMSSTA